MIDARRSFSSKIKGLPLQRRFESDSEKSSILTAMIYITDMRNKPAFNRAWDEWVDRANLPMRACLGVDLEGDDLVEIVVTAAV
jgi:enamine deaminase RidA (YjgF/YER057c/UK114 family)